MRFICLVLAALLSGAAGCSRSSSELESRSPVRGSVKVAGKPASGLIVRFHLDPGTADERAPKLVETLTDSEGAFRVSQNVPNDGLAPGKYTVTFFWPVGGGSESPSSSDQLRGRFSNPEKSQFRVEVQLGSNELPPFELK
jgi:hypothetical protein